MVDVRKETLDFIKGSKPRRESPIKVCFSSRTTAGAWQIRGEQIAAMRSNWAAINAPNDAELEQFDLFCIVKKPDFRLLDRIRRLEKPIVFDIVDSWAQPADGLKYTELTSARDFFKEAWDKVNADGYIFPTRRMQLDLGGLVSKATTIYHHFWPQIERNPIRRTVRTVGYEGADYLGKWKRIIDESCRARGIDFVSNPSRYVDIDIVVIVREGDHGSFLAKNYKSNVKLANAFGSGTPALVHVDEMSAHDTDNGDVLFFSDEIGSFERQLDRLISEHELRMEIHRSFLRTSKQFDIQSIADQFEHSLRAVAHEKHRGIHKK